MLNTEIIKSNSVLSDLTQEQLDAIVTLSKNDEEKTFGKFSSDHWTRIDQDLMDVTGIQKEYGVKSHVHLKKVVEQLKKQADANDSKDLQKKIESLSTENAQLAKTIKEGTTDAALKTRVADMEKTLTDRATTIAKLRSDIKTVSEDYEKKLSKESTKNVDLKFENEFSNALQGIAFKKDIPQMAIDAALREAKRKTKEYGKAEFVPTDNGKERIQYRDADGQIMTNPENLQKPIAPKEIFLSSITDLVDPGQTKKGTEYKGNNEKKTVLDLSGVKTRVEANETIRKYLVEQGEDPTKSSYNDKYQEIYQENKVQELPMSV